MRPLLLLPLLFALLAACTPAEPLRFYALTPLVLAEPPAESELAIGVVPINLAAYLDRTGIVIRTSPNELAISAQHNWVEPLDTQARRVVARNLALLLGTDRVFILPEQRLLPLDHAVEIAIERLEIVGGGTTAPLPSRPEDAVLEARWTLFAGDERRVLRTAFERIAVAVEPPATFERRVAALSDAMGRLSRSVATEIAAQPR